MRRLKQSAPLTEPVRVVVAQGTYPLSETIVFTPQDSGTATCPVVYEAAPGAKPVFSGGRAITGFKPAESGLWKVHLPEVANGTWYFEELFVDGRRAVRARSPNTFYYYMLKPGKEVTNPATGKMEDLRHRAFFGETADVAPLASVPQDRLSDVTLVAYHSWAVSVHRLEAVDQENTLVITTANAPWKQLNWLGFVSGADAPTVLRLDTLELTTDTIGK